MRSQLDFHGKRVLVTGSTRGLGRRTAEAFHSLGATVAVNSRSAASVSQAIEEIGGGTRLFAAPGDVSSTPETQRTMRKAIAEMGGLDVLVNTVGRMDDCRVDDVTEAHWEEVLAVSLKSAFFAAQACVSALGESKGCIVNVASVLGVMGGPPGTVVSTTAKGAMVQMTRMMALELSERGIRVNCFCPGWIDVPSPRSAGKSPGNGALQSYFERTSPLGRMGSIDEYAAGILYLAAPAAGYTTGATLVADGGLSSGHYQ